MTATLSPRRRREVIDALRRGTVPHNGLDLLAVGLARFEPALDGELDAVSEAAAAFGVRVRERRLALGKSQEQLAADSELHWSFLGQVERGRRNLTLHNILKVADALDIDPGELVTGLRPPPSEQLNDSR